MECATEFISFITDEANHQCQLEHMRAITAEDLISAIGQVGQKRDDSSALPSALLYTQQQ